MQPATILDFWFGPTTDPAHTRPQWFRKDAAFDVEVLIDAFDACLTPA